MIHMKSKNTKEKNTKEKIEKNVNTILNRAIIMNQRTGGPLSPNIIKVLEQQGVPVKKI